MRVAEMEIDLDNPFVEIFHDFPDISAKVTGLNVLRDELSYIRIEAATDDPERLKEELYAEYAKFDIDEPVIDRWTELSDDMVTFLLYIPEESPYNRVVRAGCTIDRWQITSETTHAEILGPDMAAIERAISSLRQTNATITLLSLTGMDAKQYRDEPLLTDTQREVAELAVELGYYDGEVNKSDLADARDVAVSTISKHLRSVHKKMVTRHLNRG